MMNGIVAAKRGMWRSAPVACLLIVIGCRTTPGPAVPPQQPPAVPSATTDADPIGDAVVTGFPIDPTLVKTCASPD